MRTIIIRYGIGYGTHTTDMEVQDDATDAEIEADVQDAIMERVWWAFEDQADDAENPQ